MGPSYANLFVGFIEHPSFSQCHDPKPELYGRYIDDCIGATSSTREELTQFITAVNSFHPALKHTWEISDTSLAFLDIKISIEGSGLCTSVYYKPTDSHSYLWYSSSQPAHVKNFIPFSQFLRLRRLCCDDSDFSEKPEATWLPCFCHSSGPPPCPTNWSKVALKKQLRRKTLTAFHSLSHFTFATTQSNLSFLKNFKLLQNDSETDTVFSQPPLISFKRDKNIGNFLVRSSFQLVLSFIM